MQTVAVIPWQRPPVQVSAKLAIQFAVGLTEKGRTSYRTCTLSCIRPEITREEIVPVIDFIRPVMQYPITGVRLIVEKKTQILGPTVRKEKQVAEDEFEGSVAVMRSQTTTASQAGAVQTQSQSSVNFTTQIPATPAQVYTPPAILGEEQRVERFKEIGQTEKKSLWQRIHDFFIDDSYLHKNTETPVLEQTEPEATVTPEAALPDYSQLLKNVQEAKASNNFHEQLRQNNYQIKYEDMFRSPFANTTAQVGYERPIQKIDVPVYGEQIE